MAKAKTQRRIVSAKPRASVKSSRAPRSRAPTTPPPANTPKLDLIVAALRAPKGASVPDLMALTGWQAHSVRGALAGALKKGRGLVIVSEKIDGARFYRIGGKA
ncbi:MAG: DUF3489 domain-containing protein [Hyphomonadaceae bacterium]